MMPTSTTSMSEVRVPRPQLQAHVQHVKERQNLCCSTMQPGDFDALRTYASWVLLRKRALVSRDGSRNTRTDELFLHSHVAAERLHLQPVAPFRESRRRGVAHLLQHLCRRGRSAVQRVQPRFRGALRVLQRC